MLMKLFARTGLVLLNIRYVNDEKFRALQSRFKG